MSGEGALRCGDVCQSPLGIDFQTTELLIEMNDATVMKRLLIGP